MGVMLPLYFKPLRRKIGVITLLVACVFAAGWVRSLVVVDEIEVSVRPVKSKITSVDGLLLIMHASSEGHSFARWHTAPMAFDVVDGNLYFHEPFNEYNHANSALVPYCFVVVPLTLISAWLLLSKPRAPKPVPPAAQGAS